MGVHHLALRTADVEGLAAFYRQVLGLAAIRERPGASVWLEMGGGAVLMIERAAPGEPPVPPGSMEFLALAVDGAGRERVRAAAASRSVPIEHETEFTTYLRDPDGRRVGVSTADLRSLC